MDIGGTYVLKVGLREQEALEEGYVLRDGTCSAVGWG